MTKDRGEIGTKNIRALRIVTAVLLIFTLFSTLVQAAGLPPEIKINAPTQVKPGTSVPIYVTVTSGVRR